MNKYFYCDSIVMEKCIFMKISVCIITKNEEEYIEKCIESVYGIAYEIIILDTGSTDKTKEIVKKFDKVKLFEITWKNDFH